VENGLQVPVRLLWPGGSARKLTRCTCAAADCTISLWDPHTGKLVRTLRGHTQGVSDVAWSSDSTYIASASDDTFVKLWLVSTVRGKKRRAGAMVGDGWGSRRVHCAVRVVHDYRESVCAH